MFSSQRFSKEEALKKIKNYCSYQERSHNEVKEKLYSFGLFKVETEEILSILIEENYLNEERFAKQFAGGKFRMKQWGRRKIQYELQQKGVNKQNIKLGLKEIEEKQYEAVLQKLAAKKWKELSGEQYLVRQAKTNAYLLQKGYEQSLISTVINSLIKG
ncbi:regulatory protein RecX [Segetibacter sp.]|jgi:regulatory protein|uniref:regulatory protein RecX n=1 Tax=Segetibacter sp. TaxID=2231182 RepID=UPI0026143189|nr:regulatory protein RecX [Segetibacter sp.]MCW3082179.1 regulatory protein RecX [Segetibacter sp.]